MKLQITGASNFVDRMFEACGNYQWARETLKNALEAGATRVEFGVERQAAERLGVYRRTVADDGAGMDRQELLRFFSTLGDGAKAIGGVHDNFGVGAKVSTLPWNPEGVVVVSYKGGRGSMIWIRLSREAAEYELATFKTAGGKACVVEPCVIGDTDWAAIRPDWLKDHGTVMVFLGSAEDPNTALGNPRADEGKAGGLSAYLDTRFWEVGGADVRVVELPPEVKGERSTHTAEKNRCLTDARVIRGARRLLKSGTVRGSLKLAGGRVAARWYLRAGSRAGQRGYIALKYKGELYHVTSDKAVYRCFGVVESEVQHALTVVLEPQHSEAGGDEWGVHPDQSRNRLMFSGDGEKAGDAPVSDWGLEFAGKMPKAIRDALAAARTDPDGPGNGDDYRRRLRDRYGARWKVKGLVAAEDEDRGPVVAATAGGGEVAVYERVGPTRGRTRAGRKPPTRVRTPAVRGGDAVGVERDLAADVPRYRLAAATDFEQPWHIALWAPHDPGGPTVYLNPDSPVLREAVEYHQSQYPEVYAEEVARVVHQTFGEVAACKVAHTQKLAVLVPAEELDRDYRGEKSLTLALMGLLAEDGLIARRLGRLLRKKSGGVA